MDEKMTVPFKDVNGNEINSGETVKYNDKTYVVLYIEKDNIGWILNPCGNNTETESLNLIEELNNESDVITNIERI